MPERQSFSTVTKRDQLLDLLPQIAELADSQKEALGFWPESALREAIMRDRLIALATKGTDGRALVGYIHHSGVFPNAKVQQVATAEQWRRAGAATTLVNTLVSRLEGLGFLSLRADIADNLTQSLAFYRKNGFVEVGTRKGANTRKRSVLMHVRELETDSLFRFAERQDQSNVDLGLRRRSAGDDPVYAFDLNVYFDLVREREQSDRARQLFGAALAHVVRLAVAEEFAAELKRTSPGQANDPLLQMALQLPRLPKIGPEALNELANRIHNWVFVDTGSSAAGSAQSLSDCKHLAQAALSRTSAFVTRDATLIAARERLIAEIGLDVISLEEIVDLLPLSERKTNAIGKAGKGFSFRAPSEAELASYLGQAAVSDSLVQRFRDSNQTSQISVGRAIVDGEKVVAIGMLALSKDMAPVADMLVHVRPDQVDAGLYADFLLDDLLRRVSADHPTAVELIHIPGQATVNGIARSKGFRRTASGDGLHKIALGRPLIGENWNAIAVETRRRTGLSLPSTMPTDLGNGKSIKIGVANGGELNVGMSQLADLLGPTVVVWPGQEGVLVPIGKAYADDLLGTNPQDSFEFMESKDAAFLTRRAYVSSPKNAKIMRPDRPILFYESKRTGGRGSIVAVGRIVDRILTAKGEMTRENKRRLVVDNVDDFSATEHVLCTTFDNVFVLPKPVPLGYLKSIGAHGNANLISAVSLPSEKIAQILTQGWLRDLG